MSKQPVIVFDLGGVMIHINRTWKTASQTAGITTTLIEDQPLEAFPDFNGYQDGVIELGPYLERLGSFLGCSPSDAHKAMMGIIDREVDRISDFVHELHDKGYRTACLSNTNDLHWQDFLSGSRYPTIQSLHARLASHLLGLSKPTEECFRAAAAELEAEPSDLILFDDTKPNVDGAIKAGWRAFLIDPKGDQVSQMKEYLRQIGL